MSATTGPLAIVQGSFFLPHREYDFLQRFTCCPLKQVSSWRLCTGTLSPSSLLRKMGQQFLLGKMTARAI